MLSRVAEQIYWFARYIERAENTARLILVRHQLVLDLPEHIQPDWMLLTESMGILEDELTKRFKKVGEKQVISYLFGDKENSSSIVNSIARARENTRITRDAFPTEVWERINSLYLSVKRRANKDLPRDQRHKVLNGIIQNCQHIAGMLSGTMSHDQAYQFFLMGQGVERADMSSRIIDAGSYSLRGNQDENLPYRNVLWISILRSLSAYQMYRLNVRRNIRRENVLDFTFHSLLFPRSIAFCIAQVRESAEKIAENTALDKALTQVEKSLAYELSEVKEDNDLHLFIDKLQAQLGDIHNAIIAKWVAFDLDQPAKQAS